MIERFLRYYATRKARRYLAFKAGQSFSQLLPDTDKTYLLYIHVPFCDQLCPYCSFVRIQFDRDLATSYFTALKNEIKTYHSLGYQFDSIYVGGGTPTIWPEKLVEVLSLAKSLWSIGRISVETNPDHLVPEILQILKDVGVNRLSVGVQSFSDEILASVHRAEKCGSSTDIKRGLAAAKGLFDTLNVDLIFNFPNETMETLHEDVQGIKEVNPDQVTYYPLMISDYKQKEMEERCGKGHFKYEHQAYDFIVDQLSDQFQCESVWCFSQHTACPEPGQRAVIDEYIVEHEEYIGVGPGSWGYVDGTMYYNAFSVKDYIRRMEAGESPVTACRRFSKLERMRYTLLLSLLTGSIGITEFKQKAGRHCWLYLSIDLLGLMLLGALVIRDGQLVLTRRGRYYWVILMGTLFAVVGDYREAYAKELD